MIMVILLMQLACFVLIVNACMRIAQIEYEYNEIIERTNLMRYINDRSERDELFNLVKESILELHEEYVNKRAQFLEMVTTSISGEYDDDEIALSYIRMKTDIIKREIEQIESLYELVTSSRLASPAWLSQNDNTIIQGMHMQWDVTDKFLHAHMRYAWTAEVCSRLFDYDIQAHVYQREPELYQGFVSRTVNR